MAVSTIDVTTVALPGLAWDIAADIYFPADFDASKTYPVIVSAHPTGSCRAQTSGNVYGKALAEAGFVAVAFDASFQGDSGGEPRFTEDPGFRVSDFSYVIDYLVTQPYVDADRIGVLAICGGAGYAVAATMIDRRIKALTTVAGSNVGRLMREGFSNYDPMAMLEAVAAQRTAEARGAAGMVNDLLPPSVEFAKENGLTDIDVLEATEYYKTERGAAQNGRTSFFFTRQAPLALWDAYDRVETFLTQPLLVVIGDKPGAFASNRLGMELYGRAASKDKQLVVVEGASHYDLYDQSEPTAKALEAAVPFFRTHLAA
ncbi:alpha/beta hydrolase [Microbacterium sp. No. 7]|uniref:alpha/beta hydrolase n=1 Tax=Microbacterium sp. No. 7 TaxID=1714373 RepID=UPI0006CF9CD5|nr:alpha/beta hydrolase [Microbacterium sp. No. 7]ALJ19315.1 alpha/beta hydrolase [Microbacterium sp. No. 7]